MKNESKANGWNKLLNTKNITCHSSLCNLHFASGCFIDKGKSPPLQGLQFSQQIICGYYFRLFLLFSYLSKIPCLSYAIVYSFVLITIHYGYFKLIMIEITFASVRISQRGNWRIQWRKSFPYFLSIKKRVHSPGYPKCGSSNSYKSWEKTVSFFPTFPDFS